MCFSGTPAAVAYRRRVIRRADSIWLARLLPLIRRSVWRIGRGNPRAAAATMALSAWVVVVFVVMVTLLIVTNPHPSRALVVPPGVRSPSSSPATAATTAAPASPSVSRPRLSAHPRLMCRLRIYRRLRRQHRRSHRLRTRPSRRNRLRRQNRLRSLRLRLRRPLDLPHHRHHRRRPRPRRPEPGTVLHQRDGVCERTTPLAETMASSTRCRSALVRATTRQSMSPAPVMVCTSAPLGDRGQPFRDGIVAAGLADLKRDERGDLVAERRRIDVRAVSGDHAAFPHPVQARLHRAASGPESPGGLEHAHPWLDGQQFDEHGVEKPVD